MNRFNTKIGAGVLVGAALLYMVLSLALGRPARSEPPPDLSASAAEAGLDVWKAAAAMLDPDTAVVDVRPADEFARYHVPGSTSAPAAGAAQLAGLVRGSGALVIVAGKDEDARRLVAEAKAARPDGRYHFLQDGVRAWYLAFELPVPVFTEASAPRGYDEALANVRAFLQKPDPAQREQALGSLQALAKMGYQPTLLKQSGKPKAAGPRKKIAGGCGG